MQQIFRKATKSLDLIVTLRLSKAVALRAI
jgi:hypothetical protein